MADEFPEWTYKARKAPMGKKRKGFLGKNPSRLKGAMNQDHIPQKKLEQIVKWRKPQLRKRMMYRPKLMSYQKMAETSFVTEFEKKKLQKMGERAKLKRKQIGRKFDAASNFSNLKKRNKEFASQKNKKRNARNLSKIDQLAWESVALPADDQVFTGMDGERMIKKDTGAMLEVIDPKLFFASMRTEDLDIEEFKLDDPETSNIEHKEATIRKWDDKMGLSEEALDSFKFKSESEEFIKLIEFSLFTIDPVRFTYDDQMSNGNYNANRKRKRNGKSGGTKGGDDDNDGDGDSKHITNAYDPNVKCYQCGKRGHVSRDCRSKEKLRGQIDFHLMDGKDVFETADDIDDALMTLLHIESTEEERRSKLKYKQRFKEGQKVKLMQMEKENENEDGNIEDSLYGPPAMKRRKKSKVMVTTELQPEDDIDGIHKDHRKFLKLKNWKRSKSKTGRRHGEKGTFRGQIEHLHSKHDLTEITNHWNGLLSVKDDVLEEMSKIERMQINAKGQSNVVEVTSAEAFNQCLKRGKRERLKVILYFHDDTTSDGASSFSFKFKMYIEAASVEYVDRILFIGLDIHQMDTMVTKYAVTAVPTIAVIKAKNKKLITKMRVSKTSQIDKVQSLLEELCPEDEHQRKEGMDQVIAKELHCNLLKAIADLGFAEATKVQREVIPLAVNGRNDLLIAAATGSGKTLAFGIPMVNDLMICEQHYGLDAYLYGLILTPTRELAVQIHSHLTSVLKYCTIQCACVIGGMAHQKQMRLLRSSPEIVVATPGRLWEFMSETESLHLRDLTRIRYLVLDEADRLLMATHYKEARWILNIVKVVWSASDAKMKYIAIGREKSKERQEKERRRKKIERMNHAMNRNANVDANGYGIMEFLECDEDGKPKNDGEESTGFRVIEAVDSSEDDEQGIALNDEMNNSEIGSDGDIFDNDDNAQRDWKTIPHRRQTFVVSATLTLESENRSHRSENKVPIFANLSHHVPLQPTVKVVDQTLRHRTSSNVKEYQVHTQRQDRDAMLAYLLHTFRGRNLVFFNTIRSTKLVAVMLIEMGLKVVTMHSMQQQKQRLKQLDRFVKTARCTLLCTDICARGLDIPSVDNVIHFQCPKSAEDYIHRTGRVGRRESKIVVKEETDKNGEETKTLFVGNSFLIISPDDFRQHGRIMKALKRDEEGLEALEVKELVFMKVRKRMKLANEIAKTLLAAKDKARKKKSIQQMAEEAELDLDEINCKALGIMASDTNYRNRAPGKKKGSLKKEYCISNGDEEREKKRKLQRLRMEMKKLMQFGGVEHSRSVYITSHHFDWKRYNDDDDDDDDA